MQITSQKPTRTNLSKQDKQYSALRYPKSKLWRVTVAQGRNAHGTWPVDDR
ncbi:uncharacterized protein METZ01_LOCUS336550 [marine metagenome]|uniref:Uncharacterized protein n=1 Tax=marine metagenome TaxID=408172 RepID=A0A382QE25_9ZZZZ